MKFCQPNNHNEKDDSGVDEDARLQELLDIAAQVFLEQGYEATSVGEIAKRARASKQTFYSRFPTKDELFVAVMSRKCDLLFQELTAHLLLGGSVSRALSGFSKTLLDLVLAPESLAMLRIVYMESARFPDLGRIFFDVGPLRSLNLLSTYIKEQMDKKKLRQADPLIAAAQFLDMTISRFSTTALLGINPHPSDKQKKKVNEAALDVFLRAYGPEKSS